MSTWTGRGASGRSRSLAVFALFCFLLSIFGLYHFGSSNDRRLTEEEIQGTLPHPPPVAPPKPPAEDNDPDRLPPLYPELKVAELALPQHDEDLPYPEGRNAKFVRFGNQMWGVGLNNQLFEILLNTEIARRSGRAYVFAPFIWDPYVGENEYIPIESKNHLANAGKVRAARVPLRAYFESPTSGAPWPPGDATPRAVSDVWYDRMCPQEKRVQLNATEINEKIGVNFDTDEGIMIIDKWAMYLRNLETPCATLQWETPRIIDFGLMGSPRILSIWPSFSVSPVLTSFKFSSIVVGAVEKNLELFGISSPSRIEGQPKPGAIKQTSSVMSDLITLHVRRLDYKDHCKWMAGWALFEGWNQLPFLPDPYLPPGPPHIPDWDNFVPIDFDTNERAQYMFARCWLEIDAIVRRLTELKREYAEAEGGGVRLRRVYVSTNGENEWVKLLKEALVAAGWTSVFSTSDLKLTWEESGVESAIDMELASRGQVFVGNGFSTFTSTVVSLRLARGVEPKYIRFW